MHIHVFVVIYSVRLNGCLFPGVGAPNSKILAATLLLWFVLVLIQVFAFIGTLGESEKWRIKAGLRFVHLDAICILPCVSWCKSVCGLDHCFKTSLRVGMDVDCVSVYKKKRRRRKKRIRWMCLCLCAYACATHVHALIHNIGGTLLATAWLQDSYFFYKAIKMVLRCNFEPNFSPFRIQTFNPVPPMTQNNIYIICGLQSCHVSS